MTQHFPSRTSAEGSTTQGADVIIGFAEPRRNATAADGPTTNLPQPAWDDLPQFKLNLRRLARNRIVAASRADASHVAIDILRTKLRGLIRDHGWRTIGITSPRGKCGKTTLALNLAFSLAQQTDYKIGLVDLDLRRPNVARLLHLEQARDLEGFLRGYRSMAESLVRYRHNLVIAPNAVPVSGAAELLGSCIPGSAIPLMREALDLDLIIYDLPPMLAADDALVILPAVDAVLLVVAANESAMSEIETCERNLSQPGKLAGIVLNKCRYLAEPYGY